jgi:hypothetical protein
MGKSVMVDGYCLVKLTSRHDLFLPSQNCPGHYIRASQGKTAPIAFFSECLNLSFYEQVVYPNLPGRQRGCKVHCQNSQCC